MKVTATQAFRGSVVRFSQRLEDRFQMKTPHQHVLDRPDMYVGSTKNIEQLEWSYNDEKHQIQHQRVSFNAGLYKIVDEILVNAADNKMQEPKACTSLSVEINSSGKISIRNNGTGIPVVMHKGSNMWLPVMIFGHLYTSSNYQKKGKHLTGGRFGYGAKLTNLFSKNFQVETCDSIRGLFCRVCWSDNMQKVAEPEIRKMVKSETGYTEITFTPDYERFGMPNSISRDMLQVLKRRVCDFAGVLRGLDVYWNGVQFRPKCFTDYARLYFAKGHPTARAQSKTCEIVLYVSPATIYSHVSFVNNIHTSAGGTHVDYVMDIVCEEISATLRKMFPEHLIDPNFIKSNVFIFLNCCIDNPEFDSQIKSALQTPITSSADFPDVVALARRFMSSTSILKVLRPRSNEVRERQIPTSTRQHLLDAPVAGGNESEQATLMIVEGDSAKAFAFAGLSVLDRQYYGIFTLTGKILNVSCEASRNDILIELDNALRLKKSDKNKKLRYGKVLIMVDQDNDGTHIKALLCNFFKKYLPELLRENRVSQFITPLVKVNLNDEKLSFYSSWKFDKFMAGQKKPIERRHIKYYKGLGSHTPAEAKDYFSNKEAHTIAFSYVEERDDEYFKAAFDSEGAENRKKMISEKLPKNVQKTPASVVSFKAFFLHDVRRYAVEAFFRSIPHYIDGLVPVKRKILYCVMQKKFSSAARVTQLAGYVSHRTAYHHSDTNISESIVGLAQDFIGSNNLPLLRGEGEFGTRCHGGDDHAQVRYLHTRASKILPYIFREEDTENLSFVQEDGITAEPMFYCPIVPIHFLNGYASIGYGVCTAFPKQKIRDLIQLLQRVISSQGKYPWHFTPSFAGYLGDVHIDTAQSDKFHTVGKFKMLRTRAVRVYELPIGVWTSTYVKHLEDLNQRGIVYKYFEFHDDTRVEFHVYFYDGVIQAMRRAGLIGYLPRILGLVGKKHRASPVCCSHDSNLKDFPNLKAAFDAYVDARLRFYSLRIKSLREKLHKRQVKLSNVIRFCELVATHEFPLKESTEKQVAKLESAKIAKLDGSYAYLMGMDIAAMNRIPEKQMELEALTDKLARLTDAGSLWLEELRELQNALPVETETQPLCHALRPIGVPRVKMKGLVYLKQTFRYYKEKYGKPSEVPEASE